MHLDPEQEHQLIGDIYDAALQPANWSSIIRRIAELTAADQATLIAYDRLNPEYFLFHAHGVKPGQLELYQEGGFAALDQEFSYSWVNEPGRIVANHKEFPSIEEFKRRAGALYTDFFAQVGVLYQAGAVLEKAEFRWSALGFHRGEQGRPFEDEILASLQRLVPHLRRSLQIHRQISHLNQTSTRLYRLLDLFSTGVLLLDGSCRVRYANPRAEAVLRAGDTLRVTSGHQIVACRSAQNAEFQRAIDAASRTSRRENLNSESGGVIGLSRNGERAPLMVTVTPLSAVGGYEELAHDGITTALFLSDADAPHLLSRRLLKQLYQFSEREIDVCQAFVNQASLDGVATQCGITVNSVRTYMKSLYDKTGQHSQAELLRLLMGLTLDFEHVR